MGVRFACHACGKRLHVKAELAGKRGICPTCQARIRIPREDAESLPDQREQSAAGPAAAAGSSQAATTRGAAATGDPSAKQPGAMQGLLESEPEAVWYVRPPSGGQYGPASSELLRQWIGEQRVAASALLWREGWPQWRVARDALPEFADQLPAGEGERSAGETTAGGDATQGDEDHRQRRAAPSGQPIEQAKTQLRWNFGAARARRLSRRVVAVGVLVAVSILLVGLLLFVTLGPPLTPDTIQ